VPEVGKYPRISRTELVARQTLRLQEPCRLTVIVLYDSGIETEGVRDDARVTIPTSTESLSFLPTEVIEIGAEAVDDRSLVKHRLPPEVAVVPHHDHRRAWRRHG